MDGKSGNRNYECHLWMFAGFASNKNMVKFIIGLFFLIVIIHSCTSKKGADKIVKSFQSFEIGYTNGWTKGFSFWVDSNKIFFSPQNPDTVKYGILPDSIFQLVNKTILKIISDTIIKSKNNGCVDCSIVGIQAITGNDTITIHQTGKIDKVFWPIIETLQEFIDSSHHSKIQGRLLLEANKMAFPPSAPPVPTHSIVE